MKTTAILALALLLVLIGIGLVRFAWTEVQYQQVVLQDGLVPVPQPQADQPAPNPLRNAYFGELHLHTSYSLDANLFGTANDPRTAYRFARGEAVDLPTQRRQQRLTVPLDFAAVTDHAEGLGSYLQCGNRSSGTYWSIECIGMRHKLLPVFPRLFGYNQQVGDRTGRYNPGMCGEDGQLCVESAVAVWRDVQNAANEAYVPGTFTTFIGFEYSPTLDQGGMLHRNVIFRDAHVPATVFTAYDGFAEDLLRWLDRLCVDECAAITIAHNSNFSWGLMFGDRNSDGTPVTRENLTLRSRYERLVEIYQAKGSSECLTGLGNTDETCNFEVVFPMCAPGQEVLDDTGLHARRCVTAADMVRNVLRNGLAEAAQLGFNPRKFGIVAATDNHNGLPGDTSESTYRGHGASNDASAEQRLDIDTTIVAQTLGFATSRVSPGGLTGVWAEQNTRASIFAAMQRKETFGTSGTRIRVRLFAGYEFAPDLHAHDDMVARAYAGGVPMGGDLPARADDQAPVLVVQALRDPQAAPLERIQIVKGWLANGSTREQVFDVACANGVLPDPDTYRCRLPDARAAASANNCSVPEHAGATTLAATWRDPTFSVAESAFYYARVLEVPSCRHTTYAARELDMPLPAGIPALIQERAWSSPIWYSPAH